jgi:hypothetical protein
MQQVTRRDAVDVRQTALWVRLQIETRKQI